MPPTLSAKPDDGKLNVWDGDAAFPLAAFPLKAAPLRSAVGVWVSGRNRRADQRAVTEAAHVAEVALATVAFSGAGRETARAAEQADADAAAAAVAGLGAGLLQYPPGATSVCPTAGSS